MNGFRHALRRIAFAASLFVLCLLGRSAWITDTAQASVDPAALPRVQSPDGATKEPGHAATGPELFASSGCSHCHTIDGVGGVKGPNLSGIGRRWKDDAIRKQIESGALEMPAYADVLSAAEIQTLAAYLHTRRAREPKLPVKRKPEPVTPSAPDKPAAEPS